MLYIRGMAQETALRGRGAEDKLPRTVCAKCPGMECWDLYQSDFALFLGQGLRMKPTLLSLYYLLGSFVGKPREQPFRVCLATQFILNSRPESQESASYSIPFPVFGILSTWSVTTCTSPSQSPLFWSNAHKSEEPPGIRGR